MIASALWDRWLRAAFYRANGLVGALGMFVVAGLLIDIAGTGAFVKLASEVLRDENAAPDASAT